jgi:hypothetical protein
MDTGDPSSAAAGTREKRPRRVHPFADLFLLDLLTDRDSRPVLYYALAILVGGALFYHYVEGWSLLDSFYFCIVSLATVGYGDLTPSSPGARLFTIFYLINGIVILLALFDRIRTLRSERARLRMAQRKGE